MGQNVVSRKMSTWVGQYTPLELFWCAPKFIKFLSLNVEGVVVDHIFFRCSICRCVLETLAIKVESCQTSCQNL